MVCSDVYESSSKILDGVHVTAYSFVRVIATLEFFQHLCREMGHRHFLSVTQTYRNSKGGLVDDTHWRRLRRHMECKCLMGC